MCKTAPTLWTAKYLSKKLFQINFQISLTMFLLELKKTSVASVVAGFDPYPGKC
jgi:hypothetical protein